MARTAASHDQTSWRSPLAPCLWAVSGHAGPHGGCSSSYTIPAQQRASRSPRLRPRRLRQPRRCRRPARNPRRRRRDGPGHRRQADLRDDEPAVPGRHRQARAHVHLPADRAGLRQAASTPTWRSSSSIRAVSSSATSSASPSTGSRPWSTRPSSTAPSADRETDGLGRLPWPCPSAACSRPALNLTEDACPSVRMNPHSCRRGGLHGRVHSWLVSA